jgi:hypothetical protein
VRLRDDLGRREAQQILLPVDQQRQRLRARARA